MCPTGCWENVTRISSGNAVSGDFAGEVSYFEVGVACTHYSSTGTAILTACGNSNAVNLYLGSGGGSPGFMSFSLAVPSGCNSWSLSASGGDVHFRSVDVNYSSIPDTPVPTETFTETPIHTETFTETPIHTETFTETPGFAETFTATPILTQTYTSTGSIPVNTNTPVPDTGTSNDDNKSTQTNYTYYTQTPTPTPDQQIIPLSGNEVETAISYLSTALSSPTPSPTVGTPVPFPVCAPPPTNSESDSNSDNGFPGWIIPGIGSIAAGLAFLKNLADKNNGTTLSLNNGGITIKVPHLVKRETTVGEWVSKPIKTLVKITKIIWKTITEFVPRFITVTRKIVEYIKRSKWVTTIKRVAKTVYETIWKKVPLLNWLGKIISFIWKKVIQAVIKWVNETVRNLVTWFEKVIRYVTERIQDGWNKVARSIFETITQWVEKTTWVKELIQRKITITEIQWETKFIPFPSSEIVSNVLSLFSNTKFKIGTTLLATTLLVAATATECNPFGNTQTPTPTPTPMPVQQTFDCHMILQSQTAIAATETAKFFTPTPSGTALPTETMLPGADWLNVVNNPSELDTHYSNLGFLNTWIETNLWWLQKYNLPIDPTFWQNHYNQDIIKFAQENDIPPYLLKGILLGESHTALNPGSPDAIGIAQLTITGIDNVFKNSPNANEIIMNAYLLAEKTGTLGGANFPIYDESKYLSYQNYYANILNESQKEELRKEAQKLFDGVCYPSDVLIGRCNETDENSPLLEDGRDSINMAAQMLAVNKNQLINIIGVSTWNKLPDTEQWKLVAASYNGGVTCVSNSYHDAQSASGTTVLSWDQVKQYTSDNCKSPEDTSKYPDNIMCYASGNGDSNCQ